MTGARLPFKYRLRPRTAMPWINRRWDRIIAARQALWAEAYSKGRADERTAR